MYVCRAFLNACFGRFKVGLKDLSLVLTVSSLKKEQNVSHSIQCGVESVLSWFYLLLMPSSIQCQQYFCLQIMNYLRNCCDWICTISGSIT